MPTLSRRRRLLAWAPYAPLSMPHSVGRRPTSGCQWPRLCQPNADFEQLDSRFKAWAFLCTIDGIWSGYTWGTHVKAQGCVGSRGKMPTLDSTSVGKKLFPEWCFLITEFLYLSGPCGELWRQKVLEITVCGSLIKHMYFLKKNREIEVQNSQNFRLRRSPLCRSEYFGAIPMN